MTYCDHGWKFVWERQLPGSGLKASHHLVAEGKHTRNHLAIEVTKPPLYLVQPIYRTLLAYALAQENLGLKRFCERRLERRDP